MGIRTELDIRNEKVGYKIREALMKKVPYLLILGDEEESNKTISIRGRNNFNASGEDLNKFIEKILTEIKERTLN